MRKLKTELRAQTAHVARLETEQAENAAELKEQLEGLAAETAAVERRAKKREETTRRQLADTVESLMETVNAEMAKALERIDRSDEGQQRQLAEAMERLTEAEAALEAGAQRGPSNPARKRAEAVKLPKGKLDVNSLTFEQFRALGLSATQSSRMIAMRDRVGDFSDIDQINEVVGLPPRTRTMLKRRLKIG